MVKLVVGPYVALERELAAGLRGLRALPEGVAAGSPAATARLLAPVAVLAPSRRLLAHLQRALARDHGLALANVFFETFQSFARRLLVEDGVPADRLAENPAVEERIVERALDRLPADHPLRGLAGTPGLLGSLLGTIRDLDEARVDAAALENPELEALRGAGGLEVFAPLLAALEEERATLGLLNRAQVVAEATRRGPGSAWLGTFVSIHAYGAYDLTQHQVDWVTALGAVGNATVYFPGKAAGDQRLDPLYRFAEPTFSALRQKAAGERWVAAPAPVLPDPVLVEAGDPGEEFELIAESIRDLVDRNGLAPAEIVVTARSLEATLNSAAAAFARAGIPWETPAMTPLVALPAGRGVVALARALAGDANPTVVLELLAQAWLRAFPEAGWPLARASALARRLPPFARAADWEAMAAAGDAERDGADIQATHAIAEGLAIVESYAAAITGTAGWSVHVDRWVDAFEALAPEPTAEHAAVLEAGLNAVEELRRLDAVEPRVPAATFHVRAIRAVERAGVPWRERKGGVRLLSAMDARGVRPRALFIAQANDGLFPRVAHEDPFLRDDARRVLNDPLGYKIQTKRADGGAEERLLWDLLTTAPTERLTLSWHAEDGRGHPTAPSPLAFTLAGGEPGIRRAQDAARALRTTARAAALGASNPEAATAAARIVRALEIPGTDGPTDRDGPAATGRPRKLRVTEFRDLSGCPYQVYLKAALKLNPPRGPQHWWMPESWRLGNILHSALDEALPKLLDGSHADPAAAARAELPAALASRLPTLARLPVLQAVLQAELEHLVALALAAEREYLVEMRLTPDRYEERFEKSFGGNGLTLSAQADRLDRGPLGEAHITDYKSHAGRTGYGKSARLDPEVLQVSLYLHLLAPGAEPQFSVVHLGTAMRPQVQPIRETGEEARALTQGALALAGALETAWLTGRASPWPDELLARKGEWQPQCKYCDFRTACRGDHEPTRARLERSADLKSLRDALPRPRQGRDEGGPS